MKVVNTTEHQDCFHYESGVRQTVELRNLEKGHREETTFRKNELVFMRAGEVRIAFRGHPETTLRAGEALFIPLGGAARYAVLEQAEVTIVRPNGTIQLGGGRRREELFREITSRTPPRRRQVHTLKTNYSLEYFLDGLNEVVRSGLRCRYYFDTKVRELFILLEAYYPREQLLDFFRLITNPDTVFSERVRANHRTCKTVKELAEALNMAPKLFSKKFIRIFGESANDWIRRERALNIYSELCAGERTIGQIADDYQFASQSNLNKFCLREFGKNPGKIRNGRYKHQKR